MTDKEMNKPKRFLVLPPYGQDRTTWSLAPILWWLVNRLDGTKERARRGSLEENENDRNAV
jgi:hypothetical protein